MLDEIVVTENELDDALARTRLRHAQLHKAQTRRRSIVGGVAAAVVALAILIPVLSSGDSQPIRTSNLATAADPATRPSPTTLAPSTTVAGSASIDIGTAAQSRRTAEVRHSISAGGTVAILTFGCETGGDQLTAFNSHFEGTVLHVQVTIDTDNITAPCPGASAMDKTVPIPAAIQGQDISVVVDAS